LPPGPSRPFPESTLTDSLAIDSSAIIYVSGQQDDILQGVDPTTGVVTTIAATGQEGHSGDGGPGTSAKLYQPMALAVDPVGDAYVAEFWGGGTDGFARS
jgi:hypothetical protein